MKTALILAIANIFLLAYLAFLAGCLYELRRLTKVSFDNGIKNLKQSEQMLRRAKLALSKSESATEKPEAGTTADKGGKFEKSKRADDPRK